MFKWFWTVFSLGAPVFCTLVWDLAHFFPHCKVSGHFCTYLATDKDYKFVIYTNYDENEFDSMYFT